MAIALQDQGLRQRIKNDMRNSRFTVEHKLELRNYIRGNSGGILLAKMANESGRRREDLMALIDGVRPLEFYMPVRKHRETWRGEADLLVASALDEEGATLVAYDLRGRPVAISPTEAPETPTLVIVPVETDFSRPLDPMQFRNDFDQGGEAIGTLVSDIGRFDYLGGETLQMLEEPEFPECPPPPDGCGPGGPGGPGGDPDARVWRRGVSIEEYITHMRALNDHEPFFQGAPEFYLLLAGKFIDGTEFSARIPIPEGPWSGSDDDNNAKWRDFGGIPLIMWDTDLGTRIKVQCFEDDFDFSTEHTVTGSTSFPGNITLQYSVKFTIGGGDDNCGSTYIDLQNTLGEFYYIPDGVNDDNVDPTPPYYNGTSDLQWYGFGYPRT